MGVHSPRAELQIGGVWTDVTAPVRMEDGIRHRRGRGSEGARVDASQTTLTLNDPTGRYNSRNPRSPYYGLLGRNVPLRYSVDGAAVALSIAPGDAGYAYSGYNAAFAVTDLDVRADLTPVAWTGIRPNGPFEVCGRYNYGDASWHVAINADGTITLAWSPDGTAARSATSTVALTLAPGERAAIRVTLDVDNGAGGRTIAFYTSSSVSGTWTPLGSPVVQASTTSIWAGSSSLRVGDMPDLATQAVGRLIHAVQVRNGINGTIVANPNFNGLASGTGNFVDSAGRTWVVQDAAAITSRRTRTVAEVSEWAPRWHISGNDVRAPLTASGIMHRLNQGRKPLRSTLTRGMPSLNPVAYWPLEDGADATLAYSPVPGVSPLALTSMRMGADATNPGSGPLPTVAAGASMTGLVPTHSPVSWTVAFVYRVTTVPSSSGPILRWTTTGSPWTIWTIYFGNNTAYLSVEDGVGATTLVVSTSMAGVFDGTWRRMTIQVVPTGPDLYVVGNLGGNLLTNTTMGRVTGIATDYTAALDGKVAFGHLTVFPSSAADYEPYDRAWRGELAGARVARLADEESIPVDVWGVTTAQQAMGWQGSGKLLDVLAESEAADGGILLEDRDRLGLIYRARTTLYSQNPILTIPYGHLAEFGPPRDDDARIRNDRTVRRQNGGYARWQQFSGSLSVFDWPTGIGIYDDEATLNLADDSQCQPFAQWLVHLGTVDEARYPEVRIYLHKYPQYIDAVTRLDVGSVIRVTGLPAHLPPGPLDLLVEGISEHVGSESWELSLVCSPASPWVVAIADLARAAPNGSSLVSSVSASATSLSVATPFGPLWSTSSGDWPIPITIGGEVMNVTAVTGSSSPQTMTVTRGVNGFAGAHTAGDAVTLAQPAVAAL
ncbi:hypothetical protein ACGFXC_09310 [Streptomyces sp. NPDC048507]|uniref:hypothetical protein n=1 Tax=Streptomyces sp. NPDC048507 TaxID=3365560 RepID=UPI0037160566